MANSGSDDHQKSTASGNRWVKKWVSEDNKVTGGKLSLLKWIREDESEAMKENMRESESNDINDQKQEYIRETLYLCSLVSCGRTFKDLQSVRKHAQIHQTCKHACPYKGCPKTFSFMFNMRNHLKTHYDENYHLCSFNGCNKRFRYEYKLANHINRFHQKNEILRHKSSRRVENTSQDRPYKCHFEGCDKDYIHEYKLKIHLRTMHQHGNNVSDMNGDIIITCGASSSKNKKPELNKRAKLIAPSAYNYLDQQTSESMNMMRIQREYENECNEEGSEDHEDEVDSEETEDDDNLSTYIISSRGERKTMD